MEKRCGRACVVGRNVKNEKTGTFTSRSLMPAGGITEGILSAFRSPESGSTPVIKKDLGDDVGAVKRQEAGEKDVDAHREMVVQPPSGMSEAEYDNAVLKSADSYDVQARPYDADDGPNSNTYVNDVIESTGVKLPQFDKATQQKWSDERKKKEEEKKKQDEKQKRDQQDQH